MNSFFGNFNASEDAHEREVKDNLIGILSQNVKEIQLIWKEQKTGECLELTEPTSSLCSTLEAIFLHGLKDNFLWHKINIIGGNDVDRRPEPSFWTPMLVFLHKQTIEQIHTLSQLTSEVGYCRAWIRLSISESFISSYLNNIRKNYSALNPYYKKHAMLRDIDALDVAARIIEGIEASVQINLPINSSLLNRWPDLPLQMAGLWAPPLRSCLIADGVDVLNSISDDSEIISSAPKPLQHNELFLDGISNSPSTQNDFSKNFLEFTDSEHFKIFLAKVEGIPEDASGVVKSNYEGITEQGTDLNNSNNEYCGKSLDAIALRIDIGEEIRPRDELIRDTNMTEKLQFSRSTSLTQSINSLKSPVDNHSYNTLLVRHRKMRELDWDNVWERFENSVGIVGRDSGVNALHTSVPVTHENDDSYLREHSEDGMEGINFEILPDNLLGKFTTTDLQEMVSHACKLSHEPGLDAQGFVCKSCAHPLGIGFAVAQVCAFTGEYYCEKCMDLEIFPIPAKIVYNWDFRKYAISKKAATFIQEFQCLPFIDLKLLNPDIYSACDEMTTLKTLRIRLNFIRAYLFTCCQPIINDLQKKVWSREYLYEYIHRYSIVDLAMIQRGALTQLLKKAVEFGEQHILSCPLCSVKGFICEVCNSPKVLYPFHMDSTFRCETCGAVFHDQCLSKFQPCPKCERKRRREDLPLI